MNTYIFTANGGHFIVEAKDELKAMATANKYFILGAGMWSETKPNQFKWVEGNFFN